MKIRFVSACFCLLGFACSPASPSVFCESVPLEIASENSGRTVRIDGEVIVYSNEDGTRVFLTSVCPVSFFGNASQQRVHVFLSGVDESAVTDGEHYSAEGTLQRVSAPIYDGPAFVYKIDEPLIEKLSDASRW